MVRHSHLNYNMNREEKDIKAKLIWGWMGIVPLIGFFVGSVLLLQGIFVYRNRKLVIVGLLAMAVSLAPYGILFYKMEYSKNGRAEFESLSKLNIKSLVTLVEYYKLTKGEYPDSLQQLFAIDSFAFIHDPLRKRSDSTTRYIYRNKGNTYTLYSLGIDGIDRTNDDLFPQVDTNNVRLGFESKH